jgi:hypothetical protein
MSTTSQTTTDFASGAVRGADANHMDFASMPLLGLLGVARTSAEGAAKYGRYNYMLGMPVHDLLNHVFRHLILFLLGDRKEPHLEHAAWGIMAASQSHALDPDLNAPHLLGPGATLTRAVKDHLEANKGDLKRRRDDGEFARSGEWSLADLPEVRELLSQRYVERLKERNGETVTLHAKVAVNEGLASPPVPAGPEPSSIARMREFRGLVHTDRFSR